MTVNDLPRIDQLSIECASDLGPVRSREDSASPRPVNSNVGRASEMLSVESPSIIRAPTMNPAMRSIDKISRILMHSSRGVWNVESVQLTSELELGGQGSDRKSTRLNSSH